jgi:tRNA (guanine37-N1)-methyltransferase
MPGVRVRKENAERLRRFLSERGMLSKEYRIFRGNFYIYFPLNSRPDVKEAQALRRMGAEASGRRFEPQRRDKSYPELMRRVWDADPDAARKGYEALGGIAVIDASPSVAKEVAAAILRTNPSIRTVLRKAGAVKGRYRTRKFRYVTGERNYVADYRENNCVFRFDVRTAFFSTRLAYERKRIAGLVKGGENVVVMFSGVGPFAIEIAKARSTCRVVAIELNKEAHLAAVENKRLNRADNVTLVQGDVRRLAPKYKGFADRIVMPLPKDASKFLGEAMLVAKDRCVVHYYTFCRSDKEEETLGKIRKYIESRGRAFRLLRKRTVRPYSPTEIEIVVDFLASRQSL